MKRIKKTNTLELESKKLKSHPLLCQLSELHTNPKKEQVWKESARWIKFVEVVEGSGRWSKPHVATISIFSIIDLKNLLSNGLVVLNAKSKPYRYFVDDLVENLIKENLLEDENVDRLKDTLLLPHFHQYQKDFESQLNVGEPLRFRKKSKMSQNVNQKGRNNCKI